MQISTAMDWIKRNPIYSIIGVLAPVMAFVAGMPRAWQSTSELFGIPECGGYSDVYYYSIGQFRHHDGQKWIELQPHTELIFLEMSRDRNYITLKNQTPRGGDHRQDNMLVRLPVCGGSAQWTTENPLHWIDLHDVYKPAKASAEQAKFEANLERSML